MSEEIKPKGLEKFCVNHLFSQEELDELFGKGFAKSTIEIRATPTGETKCD